MSDFTTKKGFILYHDISLIFQELTDEQAGQLIKYIVNYSTFKTQVNPNEPTGLSGLLNAISKPFINHIDWDFERWQKTCEKNRNNGKKGGRKKEKEPKRTQVNPIIDNREQIIDNRYNKIDKEKENFVFFGKIIKLNEDDFNRWKDAYSKLDLKTELQSLDDYYSSLKKTEVGNWFVRTSTALAKKNKEAPEPPKPKPTETLAQIWARNEKMRGL